MTAPAAPYALSLSPGELQRYRLMAAHAAATEAPLWSAAGIVPGASVADVGCGPAATSVELARVVGPEGRVVGVERDPEALALARQVIADAGVEVELVEADATSTGLAPESFDVVVVRHVLAHNGGAEQHVVEHVASLLRAGGCAYLVDVDLTAIRTLGGDPELEDLPERYVAFHRARGNDPWVGLRLGLLLRAAGLEVVSHTGTYAVVPVPPGFRPPSWAAREAMVREGAATPDDVERWQRGYARQDALAQRPTAFLPQLTAIGRRPA